MKLTLATFLLINDTSACDWNLDPSTWKFDYNGSLSDLQITKTGGNVKISNTSGNAAQFNLPLKTDLSTADAAEPKCDFSELYMWNPHS